MSSLVTTSTATKSNSIIDSHSSQVNTKPPRKLMYNTYIVHVSPYDVFSLLYTLAALYVAILILRQGGRKISLGGGGGGGGGGHHRGISIPTCTALHFG